MDAYEKIEYINQLLMDLNDEDGVMWDVSVKDGSGKLFIEFFGGPLDKPIRISDLGGYG